MKKLFVAILALLYISTSTGAFVHVHYCMGELADWGFGYNKSTTCGKCGMEEVQGNDNGCCKDEQKFIKNDTDQKTTKTFCQMIPVMAVALSVSFIEIPSNNFPPLTEEPLDGHVPLRINGVAVYIRNCIFLI